MIYRFDDFEIDTETFELREKGQARSVEPLVFDLICYLARNPDRVISRGEVIEAVWKGRIVSDATISSCIKSARRALGDSGGNQSHIRTVRGRGFQFVGQVSSSEAPPASGPAPAEAAPVASAGATLDRPVIAVLPFENLSADVDEYFADGLTEDIITNLSHFRELLVIARTSAFRFKGQALDVAQIGRELNAAYLVEGSVRRAAGRVRVTAQLIDAGSGGHLWADRYDREMEDIFAVQDEVTCTIAATLGVNVQNAALQRAMKKSPAQLDAYDCLLRARRFTSMLSREMHEEARDLLEEAIVKDPNYADAYALLANVYLAEHRFDANPRPDPIGRALQMAEKAVELDPQNAYARCWLAVVHFFRHANDRFEAEAQRALNLNPNDPEILADIGHFLAFMGQFERGVALADRARQLNPLHPGWYYFSSVRYHYDLKEYDKALEYLEKAGMPEFYPTQLYGAAVLGQLRRPEAETTLRKAFELKPDLDPRAELLKWNAAPHDLEHLMEGLRKAGFKERSR